MMIARVDFEFFVDELLSPFSATCFFCFLFFSDLQFFPLALNRTLPVALHQSVLRRKYEIENLLYHM